MGVVTMWAKHDRSTRWFRRGLAATFLIGTAVAFALVSGMLGDNSAGAVGPVTVKLVSTGGIELTQPFADVRAAIEAAEPTGEVALHVPGIEGLGAVERVLAGATIDFPSSCLDLSPDC